jgi:hypothetical protein
MALATYQWPVSGTVAPTAAVMSKHQSLRAQINFADADTTLLVSHNWGFNLAQGTQLQPVISWYMQTVGTAGTPVLTISNNTDSNHFTITKVAGAGTGGTLIFNLERPWSGIQ